MIKLLFFLLAFTLTAAAAQAQVILQPPLQSGGLIQKNQLWNVLIVNSSNNNYTECRLNLLLRDRQTGQEVFSASTAQFTIAPGAKQLGVSLLNPIQYNYLSSSLGSDLQAFIPAGVYTACYSLSGTLNKNIDIAEECIQLEASPLSPPMLIFPADSAILEVAPNQFSWASPTPSAMFDRLQYDILISEIQPGQKPSEAIQQNLPLFNQANINTNILNYSGAIPSLQKHKWYAWQVIARDSRNYAGKSEVWVFSFGADHKTDIKSNFHAQLSRAYTGKIYYFTNSINFSFNNPYTAGNIEYSITEVSGNKKLKKLPVQKMLEGVNAVSINISDIKRLKKEQQYILAVYNLGKEPQYLNFSIK